MQAEVCWAIEILDEGGMINHEGRVNDQTALLLNGITVNLNSDEAAVLFMT